MGLLVLELVFQWPMFFLRYYFWIAPHVLLGVLLACLLIRGLQKQLPLFFSYVAFELARFLVLFSVGQLFPLVPWTQYLRFLVLGLAISTLLKFGVIYELTNELLVTRASLSPILRPVLRWTAALLLLAAVAACTFLSRTGVELVGNVFRSLDLSSNLVLAGLVLVLFLYTRVFHISWRSRSAGIALGFGIFASVELATAALRAGSGRSGNITVDLVQGAAFHICVLVWLGYVFLPEREVVFAGKGLPKQDLEFWNQELQKVVRR